MVLSNKRVLIVEDCVLIGEVVADTISEAGAQPIGPAISSDDALDMINFNPGAPDAAILDVGLLGGSARIAARLRELGVPFVFATGAPDDVPIEHRDRPVCVKPYTPAELIGTLEAAFLAAKLA